MINEGPTSPLHAATKSGLAPVFSPATSHDTASEDTILHANRSSNSGSINAGYKIVFDNLDKTVKPRHMSIEKQSTSLHYVHGYAVKDRIDFSTFSSVRETGTEQNLFALLPNENDYAVLKKRFSIHVSRIITSYLEIFKEDFEGLIEHHIKHRYSKEMSVKSEVVSQL